MDEEDGPDGVGEAEITELFQLTQYMEQAILSFGVVGDGVSGNVETGFIIDS